MTPSARPLHVHAHRSGERGVGVVSSVFGVMAFLGFVLLVVQVVLHMFVASIVQTAALDGATHGAGAAQTASVTAAEARAEAVLGGLAPRATVRGEVRRDEVGDLLRVTVSVPPPSAIVRGLGVAAIQRSAEVRVEQ